MNRPFALILAGLLALPGCTSKVELMKRHDEVVSETSDGKPPRTEVGIHSIPIKTKSSEKTLFDLNERGQESYIASLAKFREGDPDAFRNDLLKALKKSGGIGGDLTSVQRRLVLTARDTQFAPGDRLERLDVTLALDQKLPLHVICQSSSKLRKRALSRQ
jgi:hypothetical protein